MPKQPMGVSDAGQALPFFIPLYLLKRRRLMKRIKTHILRRCFAFLMAAIVLALSLIHIFAGRGLAGAFHGHGGGGGYRRASSPGSAAVGGSFLSGGLAGAVGRQVQREAVNAATHYSACLLYTSFRFSCRDNFSK